MPIVWQHTVTALDLDTKRVRIHAARMETDAEAVVTAQWNTDFITCIDTASLATERTRIRDVIRGRYNGYAAHQAKIDALTANWASVLNTDQMALEE